tara:strand:+ start:6407 stop:8212 length:1806 start_codon:yes stop_codon:yes gene_type:complete
MGRVVEAELKLKYAEAVKNLDEFQKEFSKLEKQLDSANNQLKKNEKSTGSFTKGIKGIGTAFKAAGIGIVVALFGALATALSKNQKVMDAVSIVTGTISQVFTEIGNVLVTVYENVSSSTENFDALGRVAKNVMTIALTPMKLAFNAIKAGIVGAQLAWEQSWLGGNDPERIAELKQELSDIKEDVIEIGTDAVDAAGNVIKDFGEAVNEVSNISSQVVEGVSKINIKAIAENVKANEQLKKSADLARVANQGLIEEFDRLAEQQRQIRDDDRKGINERIEANEKLLEHLENQKEKMLENANAILAQAQAQFDLSGKDEDNIKLQEAKNELKAVEAQIEGFMSEQKSNAVALEKELNELEISGLQNKAELQKVERDFKAEMIENDVLRLEQMKKNLKEEEELETKRLQNKINSFQEGTQAQQDAQHELDLFLKESGNNQKKIDKELALAKENQTKETLGNIATIVGKNSKFGKAIAVVQAIQDTFAGANKALAQGGIFGFIGAAAVIAAGIANVKNITSTQTPKPPASLGARSTGGESTPSVPAATAPSVPPSFSTVGASGVNQLADVLGNQPPPRAFVVSGDVTTAQQLDRNIVSSASLG